VSKSQPQFRYATLDEQLAAQSAATKLMVPTFDLPPQTPRQEDPELELARMVEELFQLDFRVSDSERVQGNASDVVKTLTKKITAKKHALETFSGSPVPSVKTRCRQLRDEIAELEVELAEAKRFYESTIRMVGAAKKSRERFDSTRYQELKAIVAQIAAADAA